MGAWIGVDLDGTLAHYDQWRGIDHIGEPIAPMVERVKKWLADGEEVRIVTARMAGHGLRLIGSDEAADVVTPIEEWCEKHIGQKLPVTNRKDLGMIELWDDRAIQVEMNTGRKLGSTSASWKVTVKASSIFFDGSQYWRYWLGDLWIATVWRYSSGRVTVVSRNDLLNRSLGTVSEAHTLICTTVESFVNAMDQGAGRVIVTLPPCPEVKE